MTIDELKKECRACGLNDGSCASCGINQQITEATGETWADDEGY